MSTGIKLFGLLAMLVPQTPGATPSWQVPPAPGALVSISESPHGLLAGTDQGLFQFGDDGWRSVISRGGVVDLASAGSETWIATSSALFTWPDQAAEPRPLGFGLGTGIRAFARDAEGQLWLGTRHGLYQLPRSEDHWRRSLELPAGPVDYIEAVALDSQESEVWVAIDASLWRNRSSSEEGEGFQLWRGSLDEGWWELRAVVPGAAGLLLVVPKGVWLLDAEGVRRIALGVGDLRDAAVVDGVFVFASGQGLSWLPLHSLASAGVRNLLEREVLGLNVVEGGILAATPSGIFLARLPDEAANADARTQPASRVALDASLPTALRRAVLEYQQLAPSGLRRIEERARGTALLPRVSFDVAYHGDRQRQSDEDQVFSTGEIRDLFDSTRDSDRGYDLNLELVWSLDEHLDPARDLAISRERRELIELRDQVLERVSRLFFERLRVLREADRAPPSEQVELQLRAAELAARLDGWSGGWFSRVGAARWPESSHPQAPRVPEERYESDMQRTRRGSRDDRNPSTGSDGQHQ